jgi:DNA-binding CsgD family transcriptional regulator
MAAQKVIAVAATAGIPSEALTAGLSFDARSLARRRRVTWDEYCLLIERFEIEVGGTEAMRDRLEGSYHEVLEPAHRSIFGAFVGPVPLYRFMLQILEPILFPMCEFAYELQRDKTIRAALALRPEARPCRTFFEGTVGALRGATAHLGLPPADVDVHEISDRHMVVVITPPAARTLVGKARRASGATFRNAALRVMGLLSEESVHRAGAERVGEPRGSGAPSAPLADADARVAILRRSFGLTVRQAEVLVGVANGQSNKEIARDLDCAENTIEFHVTQLLKKFTVQGRGQLIAKVWSMALSA